jgi:hypothetical protein
VDRTRHQERLERWEAEHCEIVPGIAAVLLDSDPDPEQLPA